jgi:hypothetical protein
VRVQLRIALLVVAVAPATAHAQLLDGEAWDGSASSKVSLYADDDATRVVTTMIDGEVRLPVAATLGVHALVDAVSSASVDVVSAATDRWTENRIEAGARVGAQVGRNQLGAALVHSVENDWAALGGQLSLGRDLAQKNTRIDLAIGFTENDVGRAEDPNFQRDLDAYTGELGIRQLVDPRTLIGLTLTVQRADGYQSSPYRYVTTAGGMSALEAHPEARTRQAATLRVVRALGRRSAVESSYRFYADDWGVRSHTVTSSLRVDAGEQWDVRLRGRYYRQGAADFWQAEYAEPMRYMSADRELATSWNLGGGLKMSWRSAAERVSVDAKVEGIYYRFVDYARLDGRVALVTSAGLGLRW